MIECIGRATVGPRAWTEPGACRLTRGKRPTSLLQKPQREPRHPRHEHRAQQALVVTGHPPVVLHETQLDQLARVQRIADVGGAGRREIRVTGCAVGIDAARDAHAVADQLHPHGRHPCEEPRPAPPRHRAPVPRVPVHEEQDVAAFFLDHGLEGLDQLRREIAGALRGAEQAEREKAVDAFAEARHHPRPFGIGRRRVGRLGREPDAVRLDQLRQHDLVAGFLAAVHFERAAQQRIVDRRGVGSHADRRAAFGLHGDVPDRQRREPSEFGRLERRPVDHGRLVRVVCVEQHPTEHLLVRVGTDPDGTLPLEGPVAHRVICGCMLFLQRVGHGYCYAITDRKILAQLPSSRIFERPCARVVCR